MYIDIEKYLNLALTDLIYSQLIAISVHVTIEKATSNGW
jgi:hypothetical protein